MINYLIDASIYALPEPIPDSPNNEQINLYNNYIDDFGHLLKLVFTQEENIDEFLKINRFLFSSNDINLLDKEKLLLNGEVKNKLLEILKNKKNKYKVHDLQSIFIRKLLKFQYSSNNQSKTICYEPKSAKIHIIENYMGINIDINNVKVNKQCNPNISKKIGNNILSMNLNKNVYLLSFLNKYVYRSSEITYLLTAHNETECRFDINIENVKHNFNNIQNRCWISEGLVKNQYINNIIKPNNFTSLNQLKKTIDDMGLFNDTILFGNIVNDSIDKYENILDELSTNSKGDVKEEITYYKTEYSNTVYDCLYALDMLVKFYRKNGLTNTKIPISKNFPCELIDEICKRCCGYLRLCGFGCSKEKKERQYGDDSYIIHLKPYSWKKNSNEKHLEQLTIRIYFKWDSGTDKVKIGYIGEHPKDD